MFVAIAALLDTTQAPRRWGGLYQCGLRVWVKLSVVLTRQPLILLYGACVTGAATMVKVPLD